MHRRFKGLPPLLAGVALLALGACTRPTEAVPLGADLTVLGPSIQFQRALSSGALTSDWSIVGDPPQGSLGIDVINRVAALRVKSGDEGFALLRRTRASLLATPFLSWAWNATPTSKGAHPVQIVVGLRDRTRPAEKAWWQVGAATPTAQRIINIVWEETALGRGTIIGPIRRGGEAERATYIARGGQEYGGRWFFDTVDLSLIHHQVWPKDDPAHMDVILIGVAGSVSKASAEMHVAQIRLAR